MYALKPLFVPVNPARVRPYPSGKTTVFSACPGKVHVAAVTLLPFNSMSTTTDNTCPCSPPRETTLCVNFSLAASFGLTSAALSQVSFVTGFGNSCSQPLFANRPSYTQGSGRKMNSSSSGDAALIAGRLAGLNFAETALGGNAEPLTRPSFSVLRQNFSNSPEGYAAFRRSRNAS